jgi:tripartite ATP-independent transporter DctP family solute receptor
LKFQQYVHDQTNGEVEVKIFPNGQLGGDRQETEAVALGTLQMTIPATAVLTTYSPKFGILDLPFVFKDVDATFAALDGELGADLDKYLLKVGLRNLGYGYNGARSITTGTKPIEEPADLKGIKMRVMESPVFIDMFKALDANPTPMSFGEVYTGLQQGTVDGQENSPSLVYSMKFNEVQKYYSLTNHVQGILAMLINEKFYNSLKPEHQKVVSEGARKFLVEAQRQMELDDTSLFLEKLADAGLIINEITPENHQKFVAAMNPLYAKYKKTLGQDMFNLVDKYNSN